MCVRFMYNVQKRTMVTILLLRRSDVGCCLQSDRTQTQYRNTTDLYNEYSTVYSRQRQTNLPQNADVYKRETVHSAPEWTGSTGGLLKTR